MLWLKHTSYNSVWMNYCNVFRLFITLTGNSRQPHLDSNSDVQLDIWIQWWSNFVLCLLMMLHTIQYGLIYHHVLKEPQQQLQVHILIIPSFLKRISTNSDFTNIIAISQWSAEPGQYVACIYDKEWFVGCIVQQWRKWCAHQIYETL